MKRRLRRLMDIPELGGDEAFFAGPRWWSWGGWRCAMRCGRSSGFIPGTIWEIKHDRVWLGLFAGGWRRLLRKKFAERDRLWAAGDPGYYALSDALQYLGERGRFREPVPAVQAFGGGCFLQCDGTNPERIFAASAKSEASHLGTGDFGGLRAATVLTGHGVYPPPCFLAKKRLQALENKGKASVKKRGKRE